MLYYGLQEVDINGIRFWCYNAGHVLGAAMFMIEIAGVKVSNTTIDWLIPSYNVRTYDSPSYAQYEGRSTIQM